MFKSVKKKKLNRKGVVVIDRFEFTYQDYLRYRYYYSTEETIDELLCVAEESAEYVLGENEIKYEKKTGDKKHDKIFKDILQDKNEMAKFISHFTNYKIKPEELEIYNVNYITKDFKYKNADVVYKVKGKEIYYLIEHQTRVDYSMAYRILNYCVEIIRSVLENRELKRASKYPIVIPIVLYTGNQKWTANLSFSENHPIKEDIEIKPVDVKYKLIDVNKYEIEELLKEKTMLANTMILEKCKNNEEVLKSIKKIVEQQKGEKQLKELKRVVLYLYEDVPLENLQEIIKLIEESESEENMSTIRERLRDEYINERKEGRKEGIQETIMLIIKNMLQLNQDDKTIMKFTNAKKEDIEKVKINLGMLAK